MNLTIVEWVIGIIAPILIAMIGQLHMRVNSIAESADRARDTARAETTVEIAKVWTEVGVVRGRMDNLATKDDLKQMEDRVRADQSETRSLVIRALEAAARTG